MLSYCLFFIWIKYGFFSGIILAVYPLFIIYSEILMSEIFYTFLLMFIILFWCLVHKYSGWVIFIFMGISLGLLNLCRGNLLFFPIWIICCILINRQERVFLFKYIVMIMTGSAREFTKLNLTQDVVENEKVFKKEAIKNILYSLISYFYLTIKKFIYFWYKPVGHILISKRSPLLGKIFLSIYLILGYFTALHTLLNPQPRYRIPIESF